MNKRTLIAQAASKTEYAKWEIASILPSVFDSILKSLESNEKVHIQGFGTFELKVKKGRQYKDPKTKERKTTPPKAYIKFTAYRSFNIPCELLEKLLNEEKDK